MNAMLKSYGEAICWMASREGAVLVVSPSFARLLDAHNHAEGLSKRAAGALTVPPRNAWFDFGTRGDKALLTLNDSGRRYHGRMAERGKCSCPGKGEVKG